MEQFHGTTIISVRDTNYVALGGDGQVSLGDTVMKAVTLLRCESCTRIKYWPVSQAVPPMPFTLFEKFEAAR